jgi:hypothetical protein
MERIRQGELMEKEKVVMLKNIDTMKQEDEGVQNIKKVKAKKLLNEVEESNTKAYFIRGAKKEEENKLDNEILDYNRKKAHMQEEQLKESRDQQEMKEQEIQKLREL